MRRPIACLILAAGLAGCATDGALPKVPLAQADPCAARALGCANDINLRAMLADPADLARGAEPAAPSGDAAVAAARRHRAGEVKPLNAELSTDGE